MASSADRYFLVINAPNGDIREVQLTSVPAVLGRDESADIRVDDKKVSRRHAAFRLIDGLPWAEDLGSSNGVRLNGKRIDKRARFKAGDKIRVGGFYMSLREEIAPKSAQVRAAPASSSAAVAATRPPPKPAVVEEMDLPVIFGKDDPVAGKRFTIHPGENIVGRLEECDVPILDGSVSRQHSRLVYARERVTVSDLGSSNGTFVNNTRIDMAELADGDLLRVGNINFDVTFPAKMAKQGTKPLETRAKQTQPLKRAKPNRRWVWLGAAGLFLAAFVLTSAIFWKVKFPSSGGIKLADGLDMGLDPFAPDAAVIIAMASDMGADAPTVSETIDAGVVAQPPDMGVAVAPPVAPPVSPPISPPVSPPDTPPVTPVEQNGSPVLTAARTATSPFTKRGEDGLPLDLPLVDDEFDFEGFVTSKLDSAKACETSKDYSCLKTAIKELLDRDPINQEGKALLERAVRYEVAEKALVSADQYVAQGKYAKAFKLLQDIPEGVPQLEQAKKRAETLKEQAIEQEFANARRDMTNRRYRRAHKRYLFVLQLRPDMPEALTGLRSVEKKMRAKRMIFDPYEPPARGAPIPKKTASNVKAALSEHFGGDEPLTRAAQHYVRGAIKKAIRSAGAVARSGRSKQRAKARKMKRAFAKITKLYERARIEVSNDPFRAWGMLSELQRVESEVLPKGVKSYVVGELQESLAKELGSRGESMFDRGRYIEAFRAFEAGYKNDPANSVVVAGLKKLEERAERDMREAELAGQRGERDVCERWKRITRMTSPDSAVNKKARSEVMRLCNG